MVREEASFGNGPALIEKVWYCPAPRPPPGSAVQVTSETACEILLPSSSVSGGVIGVVVTVALQPGTGLVLTDAKGMSFGSCTFSETVLAVSFSLGTVNVISPKPPAAASGELTLTCAAAVPTPTVRTAATTARTTITARHSRMVTGGSPRAARSGRPVPSPLEDIVVPQPRSVPLADPRRRGSAQTAR